MDVWMEKGSECIVAFSLNQAGWNSGTSDALTYRCGAETTNFGNAIRSGHYASWEYHDMTTLVSRTWYHLKLTLGHSTSHKIKMTVILEGRTSIVQVVPIHSLHGFFAISSYSCAPFSVRDVKICWKFPSS
eukprot:TRINITY_DN4928_c0_g1_i3.p2 TRINITY_DN4928_c0_g1~~TRINITY_DN4928_c0_g1_i3.p2  ORF type:complete len:131 (-),score=22.43 TRINITY_DN4928_c0_g1_i3:198-590(-)